jgi:hypothetical protein
MAELLRHRQTKEAATDMLSLKPPRHISTPPFRALSEQTGHKAPCAMVPAYENELGFVYANSRAPRSVIQMGYRSQLRP